MRQRVDLHTLQGEVEGAHWDGLRTLLPAYRQLTSISIKCGATTAFWEDRWLGAEPLCSRFPVLYSHVAKHGASVRDTVNHGILQYLVPRLNCQARSELAAVKIAINDWEPEDGEDVRRSSLQSSDNRLVTSKFLQTRNLLAECL